MTDVTFRHSILQGKRGATLNRFDSFVFYFCVFDLLFLPYIRFLYSSASMILLPIWLILNTHKIKLKYGLRSMLIFAFFAGMSFIFSILRFPENTKTNAINLIIILYGYLYYTFFNYAFKYYSIPLKKILLLYIAFLFSLSLIYLLDPNRYFSSKKYLDDAQ